MEVALRELEINTERVHSIAAWPWIIEALVKLEIGLYGFRAIVRSREDFLAQQDAHFTLLLVDNCAVQKQEATYV